VWARAFTVQFNTISERFDTDLARLLRQSIP
jgi:hypothetical protein